MPTIENQPSSTGFPYANLQTILTIMLPLSAASINFAMIGVALPAIRDGFNIPPDMLAWVISIYTLPMVISMPFYGRLGDGLGKRRVLLAGISVFVLGTIISFIAPDFTILLLGRAIQGLGAGAFVPLSVALISELFPSNRQGHALSTWNATSPMMIIFGSLAGGFIVGAFAWQDIFLPVLVMGLVGLWIVRKRVPDSRLHARNGANRFSDWLGGLLLTSFFIALLLFVSGETITGVANFEDLRLLGFAVGFMAVLVWREKRIRFPFVEYKLFLHRGFLVASVSAAIRIIALSSVSFLIPLYMSDFLDADAAVIGIVLMILGIALLISMLIGGRLADRWGTALPMRAGFLLQSFALAFLALLANDAGLASVVLGVILEACGAGLSLAPLHQTALQNVPVESKGSAAGLYSLIRFTGTIFGPPLVAAIYGWSIQRGVIPQRAYAVPLWMIAAISLIGMWLSFNLKEESPAQT